MRYVLTFLLGALCIIVAGFMLGFITLDLSAPEDSQLSAAGVLAYHDEEDGVGPVDVYNYSHTVLGTASEDDVDVYRYSHTLDTDYVYGGPYPWYGYEGDREYDPYYYEDRDYYNDPWYVQAFPGFGQMAQRIIPGAQWATPIARPAPTPVPPLRPVYPQPSCWISAQPTTVPYDGSSVLQWASFNTTHASLSDVGQVPTAGSRTVTSLTSERIFSLSVLGQGGSGSCYTRISVQQPSSATPFCIISAHPEQIARGATSSLAWGSNNASSALLSGVGAVSVNGGMYVAPAESTTYTLTVFGSQGRSDMCTARVTVQ